MTFVSGGESRSNTYFSLTMTRFSGKSFAVWFVLLVGRGVFAVSLSLQCRCIVNVSAVSFLFDDVGERFLYYIVRMGRPKSIKCETLCDSHDV